LGTRLPILRFFIPPHYLGSSRVRRSLCWRPLSVDTPPSPIGFFAILWFNASQQRFPFFAPPDSGYPTSPAYFLWLSCVLTLFPRRLLNQSPFHRLTLGGFQPKLPLHFLHFFWLFVFFRVLCPPSIYIRGVSSIYFLSLGGLFFLICLLLCKLMSLPHFRYFFFPPDVYF